MVDAEDVSPLEAGRRETQEETGYDSDDVAPLGVIHPNPRDPAELVPLVLARNVEAEERRLFDSTEECAGGARPARRDSGPDPSGRHQPCELVVVAFDHLALARG